MDGAPGRLAAIASYQRVTTNSTPHKMNDQRKETTQRPYRDRQEGDKHPKTRSEDENKTGETRDDESNEAESNEAESIEQETQNEKKLDLSQEVQVDPEEGAIDQETQHEKRIAATQVDKSK